MKSICFAHGSMKRTREKVGYFCKISVCCLFCPKDPKIHTYLVPLCYKFHHRPVINFRTFALALNEEYLSPDQEHLSLSSGDILAVIPPISGG